MHIEKLSSDFIIDNDHGVHARPGAYLVQVLKPYSSDVTVSNCNKSDVFVNAKSLIKLMSLGIKKGHRVRFNIEGEDAQLALNALKAAFQDNLGE